MHPHLSTASEALSWLQANDMRRVELVFADLTSVARGKIMSTASFAETQAAKMPSLFLGLTVTGGEPPQVFKRIFPPMFPDMAMRPDWSTLVVDPLAGVPTATVICDIEARICAASPWPFSSIILASPGPGITPSRAGRTTGRSIRTGRANRAGRKPPSPPT